MTTPETTPETAPNLVADFSRWPVVLARMPARHEGRARQWLATLEAALQREQPFAIVCDMNAYASQPGEAESPEEKKAAALWMKEHLATFLAHCRGMVYVVSDEAARAALLASGRQQTQASRLPVQAAATVPEALALAGRLLEPAPPASKQGSASC